MQIFKRVSHNFALNFAINAANERKLPLVVYEGLKYYYPWANDRLHTYILEGVEEKRSAFANRASVMCFILQRHERDPRDTVARLANDAALSSPTTFRALSFPNTIVASPHARKCPFMRWTRTASSRSRSSPKKSMPRAQFVRRSSACCPTIWNPSSRRKSYAARPNSKLIARKRRATRARRTSRGSSPRAR